MPILRVNSLSKKYTLAGPRTRYATLRESIADTLRRGLRREGSTKDHTGRTLWALRNVTFEVEPGEVVGIIGRNGAGKSTLLKILSRITEPTEGNVELFGRVGSLLEVGTGFHPELTGRENIFLNGAIMGMTRTEIKKKFDAIVDFAEIEGFLDTPVKHYSSGMYMRLAFSVAAHLDPEILLVDEVLAVGDTAFQNKCIGKMSEVARGGRTVLFVSHNMAAVRRLCNRAILLKSGTLLCDESSPARAIAAYSDLLPQNEAQWHRTDREPRGESPIIFTKLAVRLLGEQPHCKLHVEMELQSLNQHVGAFLAFDVHDSAGTPIFQALPTQEPVIRFSPEPILATVEIDLPPLVPGSYRLTAWIGPHYSVTYDHVISGIGFTVDASPTPNRTFPHSPDHGFVVPTSRIYVNSAEAVAITR